MEGEIGMAAGKVWRLLEERGPLTTARIRTVSKLKSGVVHMAVGWLAREDKIQLSEQGRDFLVALK